MTLPAFLSIASQTLTSPSSTITFSSIPTSIGGQTIRDLCLIVSVSDIRNTGLVINSDTSSTYTGASLFARNSGASTFTLGFRGQIDTGYADTLVQANAVIQILDFALPKQKSIITRVNSDNTALNVWRWTNTAAVNSLTFSGATFAAGSAFGLYGVTA